MGVGRPAVVPNEPGGASTQATRAARAAATGNRSQTAAGAAPAPTEALRRLAAAVPTGGSVALPVAVAALAVENHYLTASSQEALLLSFAGDAGAAQISRGAGGAGERERVSRPESRTPSGA